MLKQKVKQNKAYRQTTEFSIRQKPAKTLAHVRVNALAALIAVEHAATRHFAARRRQHAGRTSTRTHAVAPRTRVAHTRVTVRPHLITVEKIEMVSLKRVEFVQTAYLTHIVVLAQLQTLGSRSTLDTTAARTDLTLARRHRAGQVVATPHVLVTRTR